eukprot:scaffold228418_cov19-Tisochrysis_lutea.AAC.1
MSFLAASSRASSGCCAAIPFVCVRCCPLVESMSPLRARHLGLGSPSSLQTARKARPASLLISG